MFNKKRSNKTFRKSIIINKNMANKKAEEGKLIGTVTHFFAHISVAVVELSAALSVGDTIRIAGGVDTDFTQTVESMEMEHEKVEKAKKGQSVGIKVGQKVREGYQVYKI